jgi:hypothetical protein
VVPPPCWYEPAKQVLHGAVLPSPALNVPAAQDWQGGWATQKLLESMNPGLHWMGQELGVMSLIPL